VTIREKLLGSGVLTRMAKLKMLRGGRMGAKWTWSDLAPGLLLGLLFINSSRKFGTGLWFIFLPTGLLLKGQLIDKDIWFYCMLIAATLIGGGTVLDALLGWVKARFGGMANAPAPAAVAQ